MTQALFFDLTLTQKEGEGKSITQHTSGPHSFSTPLEAAQFVAKKGYSLPKMLSGAVEIDAVAVRIAPDEAHPSHKTRFSDSSMYDEVCEKCGAHDALGSWGKLVEPCPGLEVVG